MRKLFLGRKSNSCEKPIRPSCIAVSLRYMCPMKGCKEQFWRFREVAHVKIAIYPVLTIIYNKIWQSKPDTSDMYKKFRTFAQLDYAGRAAEPLFSLPWHRRQGYWQLRTSNWSQSVWDWSKIFFQFIAQSHELIDFGDNSFLFVVWRDRDLEICLFLYTHFISCGLLHDGLNCLPHRALKDIKEVTRQNGV